VRIDRVCRQGESGDVTQAADAMRELGRILDRLTFPLNVAAALQARGFHPGAPKTVVAAESRARYEEIVAETTVLLARQGLPRGAG